jgi:hypothetical protein
MERSDIRMAYPGFRRAQSGLRGGCLGKQEADIRDNPRQA